MIVTSWRNERRRESKSNCNSVGTNSVSGSLESSTLNTMSSLTNTEGHGFPRGCLRVKSDELCKMHDPQSLDRNGNMQKSPRKAVSFRTVIIREYERVVGDNPSCSSGAPISLGWKYAVENSIPLEDFEVQRSETRCLSPKQFQLKRNIREQIMLEWGVSNREIADATRATIKAKNQRRRTVNAIGTYDRIEEIIENTTRKLSKTLKGKKRLAGSTFATLSSSLEARVESGEISDETSGDGSLKSIFDLFDEAMASDVTRPPTRHIICNEDDDKRDDGLIVINGRTSKIERSDRRPGVMPQKSFDRPMVMPRRCRSPSRLVIDDDVAPSSEQAVSLDNNQDSQFDCDGSTSLPDFLGYSILAKTVESPTLPSTAADPIHDNDESTIDTDIVAICKKPSFRSNEVKASMSTTKITTKTTTTLNNAALLNAVQQRRTTATPDSLRDIMVHSFGTLESSSNRLDDGEVEGSESSIESQFMDLLQQSHVSTTEAVTIVADDTTTAMTIQNNINQNFRLGSNMPESIRTEQLRITISDNNNSLNSGTLYSI